MQQAKCDVIQERKTAERLEKKAKGREREERKAQSLIDSDAKKK